MTRKVAGPPAPSANACHDFIERGRGRRKHGTCGGLTGHRRERLEPFGAYRLRRAERVDERAQRGVRETARAGERQPRGQLGVGHPRRLHGAWTRRARKGELHDRIFIIRNDLLCNASARLP
jgi:hypothetical protein